MIVSDPVIIFIEAVQVCGSACTCGCVCVYVHNWILCPWNASVKHWRFRDAFNRIMISLAALHFAHISGWWKKPKFSTASRERCAKIHQTTAMSVRFLKKSKNSTLPPGVVGKHTFKNDTVWKDGCVPDLPHHKCPEPEVCPRVRYAPHGFFHLQSIKTACQRVFSTCFRQSHSKMNMDSKTHLDQSSREGGRFAL